MGEPRKCGQCIAVDPETGNEQWCTRDAVYQCGNFEDWVVCEECLRALQKEDIEEASHPVRLDEAPAEQRLQTLEAGLAREAGLLARSRSSTPERQAQRRADLIDACRKYVAAVDGAAEPTGRS